VKRHHRRAFLRAVGAGFAALPFYRLVENSYAQSAGDALPLKFIGVYHPHGLAAEHWLMKASDTETAFDIAYENCSLQPFDDAATYGKSFKDKILVVEGIDHLSSANGHDSAGTIFTGSRIDSAALKPLNSSIDQFLAVENMLGSSTLVTSIALGVGDDRATAGTTLSFGPGGTPLPKIIDPVEAFNLLFANFVVGDDPVAQADAARRRLLGQSVIDYVREDVNRLYGRVGPIEKAKLDQHLTALREMEKHFQEVSVGASCMIPEKPNNSLFPAIKQYNGGEKYFDVITDLHIELLAQAMACDITRFGTLFMNDLSYDGNPLGLPADNHGSVAHTYDASVVGRNGTPGGDGNPASWLPLASFNKYSYGKVAKLMQKLDSFGVLDSTLIYASSDMGNPALHSTRNVPTLLAGGVNGKFRMGRRLKVNADCPADSPWCSENDATFSPNTNSKILVAIAQAFGVQVDKFGTQPDEKLTTGALTELA
jgi:hypothetical protein